MDIDLQQLPIPDWGLECPHCRYPLKGLPSHRCPECGTKLNIPTLVHSWTRLRPSRFTGHELPLPDFGLNCAHCGGALAGATTNTCPKCGAAFDPEALRPAHEWFLIGNDLCGELPLPGVQSLLANEGVPYTISDERGLREIYGGRNVFTLPLRSPREFFFEVLWLLREARDELARSRAQAKTERWTCPHCGEKNPGNFEVCWNCERAKGP
jgi:predicted amidophosphoribosyltransferase